MSDNTRAAAESRTARGIKFLTNEFCGAAPDGPSLWQVRSTTRGPAAKSGGARRDRTDDLLLAKQALSQLSYGPFRNRRSVVSNQNTEGAARAF